MRGLEMEREKQDQEADVGVNLGERMSMQRYIEVCPKYVHRYFLGEKKGNGFELLSEIIDRIICSKDGTRHKDRRKMWPTTTMWNFSEN